MKKQNILEQSIYNRNGEVEMERYDIAIIGTGPAGLEAAITARIRNKKIILFGNKNLSLKVEKRIRFRIIWDCQTLAVRN